jgi:hypothetical protein
MRQSGHPLFAAFLLIWLLINWGQAFATQLDPDEAYYWVYSRQLALGYFDHPPAVALMIAAGYQLFANELGVRLLTGILHIGTLAGIWVLLGKPSGKKDTWLLIALLTAMPMLQVYAFITTPDVPLLFFGIWYLVVFRRFMQSPNLRHALLLGLLMAALLYSKYHGLVWIGLIGLAHFRTLVRQPWFYAAAGFGLVLFLPHLYWQYDHNFPSFTYHLSGRDDPYELKHTTSYLLNQVAIFSPLVFPLLVWALVKYRSQDILQPSFTWLLFGFWIFFFAMSFKGHVEPQWTVLLTFPLVIIGYRHALETPGFRKWLFRMALASTCLLLVVRVFLIVPVGEVLRDFHGVGWVYDLQERADGRPVVFADSYRDPAMYHFYSGDRAYQFTDHKYRASQYDIWSWETDLQNQDVLLAGKKAWECTDCPLVRLGTKDFRLKPMNQLQVSQQVELRYRNAEKIASGDSLQLAIELFNPYAFPIRPVVGSMPLQLVGLLYNAQGLAAYLPISPVPGQWSAESNLSFEARMPLPDSLSGTYQFTLGIQVGDLPPANKRPVRPVLSLDL